MFEPSDHLLRFSPNGNGNDQAPSSDLFNASDRSLESAVWHPLYLLGINVDHNTVANIILSQEGSER